MFSTFREPEPAAEAGYWDEILAALTALAPRERRRLWARIGRSKRPADIEWRPWVAERLREELRLDGRLPPTLGPGANKVARPCLECGLPIPPTWARGRPRLRHAECT